MPSLWPGQTEALLGHSCELRLAEGHGLKCRQQPRLDLPPGGAHGVRMPACAIAQVPLPIKNGQLSHWESVEIPTSFLRLQPSKN